VSGSRHKDTDRGVPVSCENGSVETLFPRNVKTRLLDCGVTHWVRVDHLIRFLVMPPSTFDVNWLQSSHSPHRITLPYVRCNCKPDRIDVDVCQSTANLTLDLSSYRVRDRLGHTSTPAFSIDSELLRYFPRHADAFQILSIQFFLHLRGFLFEPIIYIPVYSRSWQSVVVHL